MGSYIRLIKKGQINIESNTTEQYNRFPLNLRYSLTVDQAVEYFGIGNKKLRQIINENLNSGLFIQNGQKYLVKRKKFEEWLDNITMI